MLGTPGSLQQVVAWVLEHSSQPGVIGVSFIDALCRRLCEEGVPLWRCNTGMLTLHPQVTGRNITWTLERGSEVSVLPRADLVAPRYLNSPVRVVREEGRALRVRLSPGEEAPFPLLNELRDQGGTDYVIHPLRYSDGRISCISFATHAPGGFSDEHLQTFTALLPFIALRLELEASRFATECLLNLYLGSSAAERVLAGDFKRGGGTRIQAVVWLCDLRDFTSLVERQPIEEVLALLDRYFECTAGEVLSAGGEVLKFMGDAVLAIFPLGEGDAEGTCRRALGAAEAALQKMAALDAASGPSLPARVSIALHVGEVMFGNIGAQDRLDFTAIGAAVNEVTRVEALSKELSAPLLMTRRFVETARLPATSLGHHALKGVAEPMEVFMLEPALKAR